MTNEQSIRDEMADEIAGGTISNDSGGYMGLQRDDAENIADAILTSPVIRRIQAEAWDRCVGEMPIDPDWKIFYGDNNPYRNGAGR